MARTTGCLHVVACLRPVVPTINTGQSPRAPVADIKINPSRRSASSRLPPHHDFRLPHHGCAEGLDIKFSIKHPFFDALIEGFDCETRRLHRVKPADPAVVCLSTHPICTLSTSPPWHIGALIVNPRFVTATTQRNNRIPRLRAHETLRQP